MLPKPGEPQAWGDKERGSEQRWLPGARAAWQAELAIYTSLPQRTGMSFISHLGQGPASVPCHRPKNTFGNGM